MKQYRIMYNTLLGKTMQIITAETESQAKETLKLKYNVQPSQIIKTVELKLTN